MAALAKNYDIVSGEAKGLKEQNFRLKEETSAMTTNIRDAIQMEMNLLPENMTWFFPFAYKA